MTRTFVLSLIGIFAVAGTVSAQSALPISIDQRVRISAADARHTGRVAEVSADSVRLAIDGREALLLPKAAVTRIEVSRGISRAASARKGAIRGAIISGAIGALLLPLQIGESGSSVGRAVALGAWSGGLFGGAIGAGIGASRAGERWEKVFPEF